MMMRNAMTLVAVLLPAVLFAAAGSSRPPDTADPAGGAAIYAARCSMCHGSSGKGNPPLVPSLRGDANLRDLALVVSRIHEGRGAMPPFRSLGEGEIAAVASHVRTAWDNGFGEVTAADVSALLQGGDRKAGTSAAPLPIAYTEEQATRGQALYQDYCASCHGTDYQPDDFAPGLTGAAFDWRWKDRTVFDLYETIRTTMPPDAAGSLDSRTAIDIVAALLKANAFAAGPTELRSVPEALQVMRLKR